MANGTEEITRVLTRLDDKLKRIEVRLSELERLLRSLADVMHGMTFRG
jgi:hypothetical protein